MLTRVTIVDRGGLALSPREVGALRAEFPGLRMYETDVYQNSEPDIPIDIDVFWSEDFDTYQVDRACDDLAARGDFGLRLEGHGVSQAAVDAVLTRYQRFLGRRNSASSGPVFDRVLARHREPYDCRKPLMRADLDHALDTWQWMLRLDASASLAAQIAALFHDIERLASEADVRVEQHAPDYRAFKNEHARRGGAMTRTALASTGLDQATIDRASELVAGHEQPGEAADRLLLNEADALSFFSLNSTGFLRYYGLEHTRRKVAYTLARLRERSRRRLSRIGYHPAVAELLHEAGITTYTRQGVMTNATNVDRPDRRPDRRPDASHDGPVTREQISRRVRELGEWFHNLDLGGTQTAPHHFLGDYPAVKWRTFAHAIPADLRGKTVLDIGCNAGFYSIEMKRRGAVRVLGIDSDERYLAQARLAAEVLGVELELRQLSVYDVASLGERFDLVLFMGVLYHLRHPLLALDLLHEHVVADLLVFQSMQRGSAEVAALADDYHFTEQRIFDLPGYPRLHFVEHSYSHDPTNWWIPNRACAEAMLRSAGFAIVEHPEPEVYICQRHEREGSQAVYPARNGEAR
jgi:tRNA (mo5U34)-methyltransferase